MELMPDVDDLDANAAADALAAAGAKVVAAEAEQFRLAAHWADLHAPGLVGQVTEDLLHRRGAEVTVTAGAEGTPLISEFAAAELGALLGRSTRGGQQLIADAVNVRFRHPLLWAATGRGEARVWLASKVARRCAAAGLNTDQAHWVDNQTTPYLPTLPTGRFLELVEAKIIEADPDAAASRARARAVERFVRTSPTDDHGLRTLVARARAGDVLHLVAVLDRLADLLAADGHPGTQQERRAIALRILANPARALTMLTSTPTDTPADTAAPAGDPCPDEPVLPWDTTSDPAGRRICRDDSGDLVLTFPPTDPEPVDGEAAGGLLDPEALEALRTALAGFDASRLDPITVFHVHVDRDTVDQAYGVTRIERLGPMCTGELAAWLGEAFTASVLHVRPVLDTHDTAPVDRYEIPRRHREILIDRHPHEVFPYGTLPVRDCDFDHVTPYDRNGPPGQTHPDNLAPLSRTHHRIKTHGSWALRNPHPGEYWWRSPHGHWFSVNAHGTKHHGRNGPETEQAIKLTA